MTQIDRVRRILGDALQLGPRADALREDSRLLGAIPEFDSMAVVTLINAVEERFDIMVADDEISAETFETVGAVHAFIRDKVMTGT